MTTMNVFEITQEKLDQIAPYMSDHCREYVRSIYAPCEPGMFLHQYLKCVPEDKAVFEDVLNVHFE